MNVTTTYDDALYQLVPKKPMTKLLARYEEMRQWCMRMGNRHPDSTLCCHKALGSYGTPTEHGMALLLDDMALALSTATTPPAQTAERKPQIPDKEYHTGDGLIFDGQKWLEVAPGMETFAMLNMAKGFGIDGKGES